MMFGTRLLQDFFRALLHRYVNRRTFPPNLSRPEVEMVACSSQILTDIGYNQLGSMQGFPYDNRAAVMLSVLRIHCGTPTTSAWCKKLRSAADAASSSCLPSWQPIYFYWTPSWQAWQCHGGTRGQKSLKTPADTYRLLPFACMSSGPPLKLRVSSGCETCTLLIPEINTLCLCCCGY